MSTRLPKVVSLWGVDLSWPTLLPPVIVLWVNHFVLQLLLGVIAVTLVSDSEFLRLPLILGLSMLVCFLHTAFAAIILGFTVLTQKLVGEFRRRTTS